MWPTPRSRISRRPGSGDVPSRDVDGAGRRASQPGQDLDELGLPVAVDAGDADDLARAHVEARCPRTFSRPRSSHCPDVLDLEQRAPGARRRLLDAEQHLAPHHEAREAGLGRALAGTVSIFAASEHGDPVGDLEHLVQLVGDEDDRHAFAVEGLEDREELARLLRREDGRRLVEDQDVRSAVERLQDLHPLLLSDA